MKSCAGDDIPVAGSGRSLSAPAAHVFLCEEPEATSCNGNQKIKDDSPHKDKGNEPKRGNWASKTEFILSCMGYAIGIGNVWRFPYLCYRNGGGAFLVPYLLMLFLCGIPLFFMETALGQFASSGCVTIFRICPIFKGVGFAILVVNFLCTMYYNVIISYPLYFLAMSFRSTLPWVECNNPWNTEVCMKLGSRDTEAAVNGTGLPKTPADEFFHNGILEISEDITHPGSLVWPLVLCDAISWIMVFLCIMNGVKSVGKVVYFTATFPFVILFVLLLRGVTLPGAMDGILFYIYPQWDQLSNLKVWADAAIQIFFSLGPGWGGIINMASYNNFKNDNKWDSVLVPVMNCGTSIFAGFVVFSVLGFMSHETGVSVSTVATGGPGLAFVTYPEAITMLPFPHLWAILFFVMLYLLGLDSCFVQIEAIISSVTDEFIGLRKHKRLFTLIFCFTMFIGSLSCVTNGGIFILQLLDWYCASISVILICTVEVLIVGWIYGLDNFVRDIEFMIEKKVSLWSKLCLKYITPIILIFIFITTILFNTPVTYNNIEYPKWTVSLGWLSAVSSMIWIPIYMIYKLSITPGTLRKRLESSLHFSEEWGPESPENRREWLHLLSNKNAS